MAKGAFLQFPIYILASISRQHWNLYEKYFFKFHTAITADTETTAKNKE
jgi:hypothetical protein